MSSLSVRPIQTPILRLGDALLPFIVSAVEGAGVTKEDLEGSILGVTSKIVSLAQRRIVPKSSISKKELVERESDHFLGEVGYGVFLTIKHGLFIPSAGIDESNAEGDFFILYPVDPFFDARVIRDGLVQHWDLKHFGVILTDSKTTPLRAGVTGASLAYSGFSGIDSKVGAPDLFGRTLKMTRINVADALASAAVFCMGEGNESQPLALLKTKVQFYDHGIVDPKECEIPIEEDLYAPVMFRR
jgi:dihydrofolate synthase / folylpolyglutamate synthase